MFAMVEPEVSEALLHIARALCEIEFQLDQQYKALRCMLNAIDAINAKIESKE